MKVRKEDLQIIREDPIELFYQGMKSSATKDKYTRTLKRTLCDIFEDVLEDTFENKVAILAKKGKSDPEWLMSLLLSLSKKLKERTNQRKAIIETPHYKNDKKGSHRPDHYKSNSKTTKSMRAILQFMNDYAYIDNKNTD